MGCLVQIAASQYADPQLARPAAHSWFQIAKKPLRIRFLKSWNWLVILMPATVLNMKQYMLWPETEIMWICSNLLWKTRKITSSDLIFGEFGPFGTTVRQPATPDVWQLDWPQWDLCHLTNKMPQRQTSRTSGQVNFMVGHPPAPGRNLLHLSF